MKLHLQSRLSVLIKKIIFLLINLFILSTFLLCASCSVFSKNVLPNTSLKEDEGVLITKIRTNVKDSRILVHEKEETWPLISIKPEAPEDLQVLRIKAATAFFSKIFMKDSFVWGPPNYFKIEAGKMTYVGDLVIEWAAEKEGIIARIIIIDREEETMAEVRKKYPWLFTKFSYNKSIAGVEK